MGSIDGVFSTESGWRGRDEVVVVEFDPTVAKYDTLLTAAQKFDCAKKVFTHHPSHQKAAAAKIGKRAVPVDSEMKPVKLSEQLYYLRKSIYRHLPLTELQAIRINGALYQKSKNNNRPEDWLSPRQLAMLKQVAKRKRKGDFDDSLQWPDDDTKLIAYSDRLAKHLSE